MLLTDEAASLTKTGAAGFAAGVSPVVVVTRAALKVGAAVAKWKPPERDWRDSAGQTETAPLSSAESWGGWDRKAESW